MKMNVKMMSKQRAETAMKKVKRPIYTTLLWHDIPYMMIYVQKSLPQQM